MAPSWRHRKATQADSSAHWSARLLRAAGSQVTPPAGCSIGRVECCAKDEKEVAGGTGGAMDLTGLRGPLFVLWRSAELAPANGRQARKANIRALAGQLELERRQQSRAGLAQCKIE